VRAKLHLSEKYVDVQIYGRVGCAGLPLRRHKEYTNSVKTLRNHHALYSWETEGCFDQTMVNITTFPAEKDWIDALNLSSTARADTRSPTGDLADTQEWQNWSHMATRKLVLLA